MRKFTLVSPIRVTLPRKTVKDVVVSLNLNIYRNAHHSVNNAIKQEYRNLMLPKVIELFEDFKVTKPIRIDYTLTVGTKRKLDISNVLCVVDKCFQDVLTEAGVLPDDNYEFVTEVRFKFGGYSKGLEQALIEIHTQE